MFKIIIVDDEILARVGVKSLISWQKHGFEIIAECDNGKKAYELAIEHKPDIIITDIKMPVMNGLDLIKALQAESLNIKFIILSSYDDFALVKEAMKLGAEDYILKLQMDPESFLSILENVRGKIESEQKLMKKNISIEKQIIENISALKERFLMDLVHGKEFSEIEIEERFSVYNINLPQRNLICLATLVENVSTYKDFNNDDLLKFSYTSIVEEIILNYGIGCAFCSDPDLFTVICSIENDRSITVLNHSIQRMARDIKEYMKDSMDLDVSIGISELHQKYSEIFRAYREAREAISSNMAFQSGIIISYSDIKDQKLPHSMIHFEEEVQEIENALKSCSLSGIQAGFDNLVQKIASQSNISKKHIIMTCHILIYFTDVFINMNNLIPEEIWGKGDDPYVQVSQLKTLDEYMAWIKSINGKIIAFIQRNMESNSLVLKAKQYINQHYCENISLEVVADFLALSPSYFSRLFRRNTGDNFIDYLTNLRISYAKELLKSAKYKIYEISEMVGFENSQYFSRVFKKCTGLSPLDFKTSFAG